MLPPQANRPPLKRDATGNLAPTINYQRGLLDVRTISIHDMTTNIATVCTATSISAVITTTVPVWLCTTCPTPYNAVFVSPVSVSGIRGVPSPPSGYKVGQNTHEMPMSKILKSRSL